MIIKFYCLITSNSSVTNLIFDGAKVLADRKNIKYQFQAPEKTVEMDFIPDYITKIVGNLMSNAIKFTPLWCGYYQHRDEKQ